MYASLFIYLFYISIDAIKKGGKWKCGKFKGKPVRQIYLVPLKYTL